MGRASEASATKYRRARSVLPRPPVLDHALMATSHGGVLCCKRRAPEHGLARIERMGPALDLRGLATPYIISASRAACHKGAGFLIKGPHKDGGARVEGQVGGQPGELLADLDHALARVRALPGRARANWWSPIPASISTCARTQTVNQTLITWRGGVTSQL